MITAQRRRRSPVVWLAASLILLALLVFVSRFVGHSKPLSQPQSTRSPARSILIAVEPPGPLVDLSTAQSEVQFGIAVPATLPKDVSIEGVRVAEDGSDVRIHFSNGVVLFEYPSADSRPSPNGLEFETDVNGIPALGVKGDVPNTPPAPVSQLKWWTGKLFLDLYGPVTFDVIQQMASAVPISQG